MPTSFYRASNYEVSEIRIRPRRTVVPIFVSSRPPAVQEYMGASISFHETLY